MTNSCCVLVPCRCAATPGTVWAHSRWLLSTFSSPLQLAYFPDFFLGSLMICSKIAAIEIKQRHLHSFAAFMLPLLTMFLPPFAAQPSSNNVISQVPFQLHWRRIAEKKIYGITAHLGYKARTMLLVAVKICNTPQFTSVQIVAEFIYRWSKLCWRLLVFSLIQFPFGHDCVLGRMLTTI